MYAVPSSTPFAGIPAYPPLQVQIITREGTVRAVPTWLVLNRRRPKTLEVSDELSSLLAEAQDGPQVFPVERPAVVRRGIDPRPLFSLQGWVELLKPDF